MLPTGLLALLQEWRRVGRRERVLHVDGWLFTGQHYLKPLSTPAAAPHCRGGKCGGGYRQARRAARVAALLRDRVDFLWPRRSRSSADRRSFFALISAPSKSPTHNLGFAIRRVIRLMEATRGHALEKAMVASQSLTRRRHRLSHAIMRSTTQRRGRMTKRRTSERLITLMARRSRCAVAASRLGPA